MPAPYKRKALPPALPDTALQQLRPDLFPGERRQLRQQLSLQQPFVVLEATADSMLPPPPRPPQHRQQPPALGQSSGSGVSRAAGAQVQTARLAGQQRQQRHGRDTARASPREVLPTPHICPRCCRPLPTGQVLVNARRQSDQHPLRLCQNCFMVDSNLQHATPSATNYTSPKVEPGSQDTSSPVFGPVGEPSCSSPLSLELQLEVTPSPEASDGSLGVEGGDQPQRVVQKEEQPAAQPPAERQQGEELGERHGGRSGRERDGGKREETHREQRQGRAGKRSRSRGRSRSQEHAHRRKEAGRPRRSRSRERRRSRERLATRERSADRGRGGRRSSPPPKLRDCSADRRRNERGSSPRPKPRERSAHGRRDSRRSRSAPKSRERSAERRHDEKRSSLRHQSREEQQGRAHGRSRSVSRGQQEQRRSSSRERPGRQRDGKRQPIQEEADEAAVQTLEGEQQAGQQPGRHAVAGPAEGAAPQQESPPAEARQDPQQQALRQPGEEDRQPRLEGRQDAQQQQRQQQERQQGGQHPGDDLFDLLLDAALLPAASAAGLTTELVAAFSSLMDALPAKVQAAKDQRLRRLLADEQFRAASRLMDWALYVEPLRLGATHPSAATPLEASPDLLPSPSAATPEGTALLAGSNRGGQASPARR